MDLQHQALIHAAIDSMHGIRNPNAVETSHRPAPGPHVDAAPHLIYADYLQERNDPRSLIIRGHVARNHSDKFQWVNRMWKYMGMHNNTVNVPQYIPFHPFTGNDSWRHPVHSIQLHDGSELHVGTAYKNVRGKTYITPMLNWTTHGDPNGYRQALSYASPMGREQAREIIEQHAIPRHKDAALQAFDAHFGTSEKPVNHTFRMEGMFTPRTTQPQSYVSPMLTPMKPRPRPVHVYNAPTLMQKFRQALHLAAVPPIYPSVRNESVAAANATYPPALTPEGTVSSLSPGTQQGFYGQEQQAIAGMPTKSKATVSNLVTEAETAKPGQATTFPSSEVIKNLALLGSPAKGEYAKTAGYVHSMFGFHPYGEVAWHAANAVLSPQTAYEHHTRAASMVTAHWLNSKAPQDEESVRHLLETLRDANKGPGKDKDPGIYRALSNGTRLKKLINVLTEIPDVVSAYHDPHLFQKEGGLNRIADRGLAKTSNFGLSYLYPEFGAALDIHMMHPTFPNELQEFAAQSPKMRRLGINFDPEDQASLHDLYKRAKGGDNVRSDLVELIDKYTNPDVAHPMRVFDPKTGTAQKVSHVSPQAWVKDIKENLISKPANYIAYKTLVREAARKLGWRMSEVQEAAWTAIVGIKAAQSLNIPNDKVIEALDNDTIRKGWQNHESFLFTQLANSGYARKIGKSTFDDIRARIAADAAKSSRPGLIHAVDPSVIETLVRSLTRSKGVGAAQPVKRALEAQGWGAAAEKAKQTIGIKQKQQKAVFQMIRAGIAMKNAMHNMPVDFNPALQRAQSSNFHLLATKLRDMLNQAGARNPVVYPAIHDFGGKYRTGVLAHAYSPGRPDSPAWMGLFSKQPGIVSFTANQMGKDRMYRFSHPDAAVVGKVLDQAGILNRVIVPHEQTNHVYVYDPGERLMPAMGQAMTALGLQAETWPGTGQLSGGHEKDMGRSQYRDQINRTEAQTPPVQAAPQPVPQPVKMSKSVPAMSHPMLGNYRHSRFSAADLQKLSLFLRSPKQITHQQFSDLMWHMPGNHYKMEVLPTEDHPEYPYREDELSARDLHGIHSDDGRYIALTTWAPPTVPGRLVNWKQPFNGAIQSPYIARRLIYWKDGRPVLKNDYSLVNDKSPYKGITKYNLLRQLESAHEIGIPQVSAHFASIRPTYIGGLVWPLLGGQGTIPWNVEAGIPPQIAEAVRAKGGLTRNVQDILSVPGGKEWWVNHHVSIGDGHWDTDPNSKSFQVLAHKTFPQHFKDPNYVAPPEPPLPPVSGHPSMLPNPKPPDQLPIHIKSGNEPTKMSLFSPPQSGHYKLLSHFNRIRNAYGKPKEQDPLLHHARMDMVAHIIQFGHLNPRHEQLLDNI